MSYSVSLADRVRGYLANIPNSVIIEEKLMFSVLNFMVNGKTCICVTQDKLMLRFNPSIQIELSERVGYETMLMKGKTYKGYCYFNSEGFQRNNDFNYLMEICLAYNREVTLKDK